MSSWQQIFEIPLWGWLFVAPSIIALIAALYRKRAQKILAPVWKALDTTYAAAGILAAIFMILILVIIVAQMIARWTGLTFEGSTEFAGYAMAATSFFALAHALGHGAHIRVSIILNINNFTRLWVNALALFITAITATYFARYAIKTNFLSEILNDRTQGQDQIPQWVVSILQTLANPPSEWAQIWANTTDAWIYTPIWVPQIPMSVGTVLLAIALWDHLIRLLVMRQSDIKTEMLK